MRAACAGQLFPLPQSLSLLSCYDLVLNFFLLSFPIGKKRNPGLKIPKEAFEQPQTSSTPPRDLDSKACISIGNQNFEVKADDLEPIMELGRGAYGVVEKMRHVPSGQIMAVKRIRATVNSQEQKRLLMDLDISMRTVDCPFTVTFYGALFREVGDPSIQSPRGTIT
uniref:mitogen-activated protein kinase kinase n=1 Tax=Homo sapiens TaxID=9606 RepID=Q6MZH7_HUMAN|nr:hypothetical protein [Homo sapiens]